MLGFLSCYKLTICEEAALTVLYTSATLVYFTDYRGYFSVTELISPQIDFSVTWSSSFADTRLKRFLFFK